MLKAGILFPRSGIFPLLGNDFIGGIRSLLKKINVHDQVELVLEPVGFGGDKKEAYQKTEQLLLIQNVDILVAFLDMRVADIIYPLAEALQKPVIIVNPGANYADNWVATDNIFFLDLKDALLSRLSGLVASKHDFSKAVFAISYYDGGYHHGHSLVTAFQELGGELVHTYISPLRSDEFNINELSEFLQANPEISCLLSLFSGDESNRFLKELKNLDLDRKLHIFSSLFMLEEQTVAGLDCNDKVKVYTYLPWHSGIDSVENEEFKQQIIRETTREANLFSLLGWEAGIIISEYLNSATENGNGSQFLGVLKNQKLVSPRGKMMFDSLTHHWVGPGYFATVDEKGWRIEEFKSSEECMVEWKQLIDKSNVGDSSGWMNTYLCS